MFGQILIPTTPASTGSHWYCRCLVIALSLSYASTNPVILINGGGSDVDPTLMDCSQQTPEYDFETGLTTYRCKPVLKDVVEKIYVSDAEDNNEANNSITETMIVKSDSEDDKDDIKYKGLRSRSSKKRRKNRKNRKSKNTKSKNYSLYERMISDAPMNDRSETKMSINDVESGKVHSVGKFEIKNRCAPGEVYASELHICLPHKNKNKHLNYNDRPQSDAFSPKSKHDKNEWNKLLKFTKSDSKNRCGLGEVYVSELDICLPHKNNIKYSNVFEQPQADALILESNIETIDVKRPLKVGKYHGKSRCGSEEIYVSELGICIHNAIKIDESNNIYDQPQADSVIRVPYESTMYNNKIAMKVSKFEGKSRCGPGEVYVSELDICLPHANKLVQFGLYDTPQGDSLTGVPYESMNDNMRALKDSRFDGKSRCGSGEVYVSELDICLPHENKLVQFSLHGRPQKDIPEELSYITINESTMNDNKRQMKVGKFEGKSRCGSGEVYLSELDICLPQENKLVQFSIHNRPQGDIAGDKSEEIDES